MAGVTAPIALGPSDLRGRPLPRRGAVGGAPSSFSGTVVVVVRVSSRFCAGCFCGDARLRGELEGVRRFRGFSCSSFSASTVTRMRHGLSEAWRGAFAGGVVRTISCSFLFVPLFPMGVAFTGLGRLGCFAGDARLSVVGPPSGSREDIELSPKLAMVLGSFDVEAPGSLESPGSFQWAAGPHAPLTPCAVVVLEW